MSGDSDEKTNRGMEAGVSLGSFNLGGQGPGTYQGGVFKLWAEPEADLLFEAESFLRAADRCLNGCKVEDGVEILTVPGTVCAALSCELFLKFVVLKESGAQVKKHKLDELFGLWSAESQAAMLGQRPDFLDVLTRNNDHFVGARYHHERQQFSFRQQELLQAAESLALFVRERFNDGTA